ncbi:hypothetical protein M0Q50_06130 [bacterium]|jgi:hypothetical protein|nr:hypothetical protein [bacterium]
MTIEEIKYQAKQESFIYHHVKDYMIYKNIEFLSILDINMKNNIISYWDKKQLIQHIDIDDFQNYINIELRKKKLNSL